MPTVLRDLLELPWDGTETTPESAFATDVANGASEISDIDADVFGLICRNVEEISVFKIERLVYSDKPQRPNLEWDIFLVQRLTKNSWYFGIRQDPYARYLLFTEQGYRGLFLGVLKYSYDSEFVFRVYKNQITYTIMTPSESGSPNLVLDTWYNYTPKFRVQNRKIAEEVYGSPNVTANDEEANFTVSAVAPAYAHWLYHMVEFGTSLAEVRYTDIINGRDYLAPGNSVDVGTAASNALTSFTENTKGFFNDLGKFDVVAYIRANKKQAFSTLGTLLAMYTGPPGILAGVFVWNVIERQELLTKIMLDLYNAVRGDLEYAQTNAVTTVDKVRLAITTPVSIAWNFGTAAIKFTGAMTPTLTVLVVLNPFGLSRLTLAKQVLSAGVVFVRWVVTPQGVTVSTTVAGAVAVATVVQGVKMAMDYLVGVAHDFFNGKLTLSNLGPKIQQLYQQGSEIVQAVGTSYAALALVGLLSAVLTAYNNKKREQNGEASKEGTTKRRRRQRRPQS